MDRTKLRDLLELGKPRITLLVLFTSAVGLWLGGGGLGPARTVVFLAATALLVASANTLNCYVERETDGRMRRTRERALPAGRLAPRVALVVGIIEAVVALAGLLGSTQLLTVGLGLAAHLSYVLIYTPLKRVSWSAVIVGAVPGALPPLMGFTAATGSLGTAGLMLFGILFLWQLPHFIAISLYLEEDYRRGGLKVLPVACGDLAARRHLFAYTVLLVLLSLAAPPLGLAGMVYAVTAAVLGAGFLFVAGGGLRRAAGKPWARRAFAYSLVYLPVLIAVLVLDAR